MAIDIGRRRFVAGFGGASLAWPLAARAQQPAKEATMPVIGFLTGLPAASALGAAQIKAFNKGLSETGFIEGQNVAIEYRYAEGQYDRLPALAADLVGRKVSVLATLGGVLPALAGKAATTTIPIVFFMGSDPIKAGVVTSLNRPEGNVTGVSFLINSLGTKRLELLSQMVPKASTIGILANPTNPDAEIEIRDGQTAAQALGRKLIVVNASTENDFEAVFATLADRGAGALAVAGDPFVEARRDRLIALAASHRMPAMYVLREDPVAGGLMSYGTSISDAARQGGVYVGAILKGAKPADLPVIQSTKFEFVINLKTAKALGLEVPPSLLALADDVIE
jgi:putative ABC transport system substrate-binding protein